MSGEVRPVERTVVELRLSCSIDFCGKKSTDMYTHAIHPCSSGRQSSVNLFMPALEHLSE